MCVYVFRRWTLQAAQHPRLLRQNVGGERAGGGGKGVRHNLWRPVSTVVIQLTAEAGVQSLRFAREFGGSISPRSGVALSYYPR